MLERQIIHGRHIGGEHAISVNERADERRMSDMFGFICSLCIVLCIGISKYKYKNLPPEKCCFSRHQGQYINTFRVNEGYVT